MPVSKPLGTRLSTFQILKHDVDKYVVFKYLIAIKKDCLNKIIMPNEDSLKDYNSQQDVENDYESQLINEFLNQN